MSNVGTAKLEGVLSAVPLIGGESAFPTGVANNPFALTPASKPYGAVTGFLTKEVASPSSFESLPGVSATVGPVKAANTVYVRTNAAMDLRVTQLDGAGSPATPVVVAKVKGLLILEVDPAYAVVALEVKGSGRVEWFASGNT